MEGNFELGWRDALIIALSVVVVIETVFLILPECRGCKVYGSLEHGVVGWAEYTNGSGVPLSTFTSPDGINTIDQISQVYNNFVDATTICFQAKRRKCY